MDDINNTHQQRVSSHNLQTIGTDGQSSITQFLHTSDLISFSQVSRLCYDILKRQQSYYQLPFPSFHRTEFNILKYDLWRQRRQPLIVTPEQLLDYSHSLVMSHATDIELHFGECELYAHPSSISSSKSASSSTSHSESHRSSPLLNLDGLREAVGRYQHVRAFKILFRHHLKGVTHTPRCLQSSDKRPCLNSSTTWPLLLIRLCLELWGHSLISFECERHISYSCVIPKNFLVPCVLHLTSIQHVGIRLRRHFVWDEVLAMASAIRFPTNDSGLIYFHGMDQVGSGRLHTLQPSNAAHCLWVDNKAYARPYPVFECFEETQQLVQPYPFEFDRSGYHRPTLPFMRPQLRNLSLVHLAQVGDAPLRMLVENFAAAAGTPSPLSGGATLMDSNSNTATPTPFLSTLHLDDRRHGTTQVGPVTSLNCRPFLAPFRHQLTHLAFTTNHRRKRLSTESGSSIQMVELVQPSSLIPFDLVQSPDEKTGREWTRLESLSFIFTQWDVWADDLGSHVHANWLASGQIPLELSAQGREPFDRETWIALGRTLPHVHTLRLSFRLFSLFEPLNVGLLNQIKHFTLSAYDHPLSTPSPSVYIFKIVCELPQLESIYLDFSSPILIYNQRDSDNQCSTTIKFLAPLLRASTHLRWVRLNQVTYGREELWSESFVLLYYAFWQLLQPSVMIPYQSTTLDQLLHPFLSHQARQAVECSRVAYQAFKLPSHANTTSVASGAISHGWRWLKTHASRWMDGWNERRAENERVKSIQRRELMVKQFQRDLLQHLSQVVEASSSAAAAVSSSSAADAAKSATPSQPTSPVTIQPRACTIQLVHRHESVLES